MSDYDIIVVGAGTAGLPCAIFAAGAGARVLLIDKEARIGGTLHLSRGEMAGAGTRRQTERGIDDTVESHFEDLMRISSGTLRKDFARIAVQYGAWLSDWLQDEGFEFAPDSPRIESAHEPYGKPRTFRGVEEGRSVLKVLARLLEPLVDKGAITLALNARPKALLTDAGRVVGLQYAHEGRMERVIAGRGVVLATGGFAASPELFKEIEGFPLVSAAADHATGEGLVMARALGASIAGRGTYLPWFGGLPHPENPGKVRSNDRPVLAAQERPPYEIYVDRFGKRWIAEDEPSLTAKARALLKTDGLTFFAVFDDHAIDTSGAIIAGWSKDDLRSRAGKRAGVFTAATLEALAEAASIDAFGLTRTVEAYNGFVKQGVDPEFGRKFLPGPIAKAPFYALQNHGTSLMTFAGVDVDSRWQVRREDGSVIDGLFAVGEILGAGATCGQSYCGGMTVGPAIIFGKRLGEQLAGKPDPLEGDTAEIAKPRQ